MCEYILPSRGPYGPDLTQASVSLSLAAHCDQEKWFWNKKITEKEGKLHEDTEDGATRRSGVAVATLTQIQVVPAQSFADFEVENDDVDIENELWDTSIAHWGGVFNKRDADSALLSESLVG